MEKHHPSQDCTYGLSGKQGQSLGAVIVSHKNPLGRSCNVLSSSSFTHEWIGSNLHTIKYVLLDNMRAYFNV